MRAISCCRDRDRDRERDRPRDRDREKGRSDRDRRERDYHRDYRRDAHAPRCSHSHFCFVDRSHAALPSKPHIHTGSAGPEVVKRPVSSMKRF